MKQGHQWTLKSDEMKGSLENPDLPAFSRRRFLQGGALTVAGATGLASFSVGEARACMECLTEKLEGKYPIGKTTLVGNEVVPARFDERFAVSGNGSGHARRRDGSDEVSDDV